MAQTKKNILPPDSFCTFSDLDVHSGLKQKRKLSAHIAELIFHYRKKGSAFSYCFTSDSYLHQMNLEYLQHDDYTDIITFDLTEKDMDLIVADIYISIDRVRENARKEKVPVQQELLRVIIHGALHMAGFGDKTPKAKTKMRSLEEFWMAKFSE
ncbi:MAG: rRNA maturation RNase YbeY [Chitinophagaceae bacterium]|nr:rRNA maturation RNase YbeY [Chitinophagaceae bacterium]